VFLVRLPGVFRPHSDSLLLADHVRREHLPPGARALDLCTGSGVLAVAASTHPGVEVVAIDVSRRAALTARLNGLIRGRRIDGRRGDLFGPVHGEEFDLIASNPPYLPSPGGELPSSGPERAWEAGPTGRDFLDRICAEAPRHLRPGGVLLLTHSTVCGEHETLAALTARGLDAAVAARVPGPLGERLRARSAWLRERGLIGAEPVEEILIIRAVRPASAHDRPTDLAAPMASAA
jgi:release factor glutamine methyltransferase